jgi:hypothetical protein
MRATKITATLLTATGLLSHTTEFWRSEDCGFARGRLVTDLPDGRTVSISRDGKAWIVTTICDRIGVRSESFDTKSAALNSVAVRAMDLSMCTD